MLAVFQILKKNKINYISTKESLKIFKMEKNNTISTLGNQNIVIQDVKANSIVLNVNGDVKEIRSDLAELKNILQQFQVETFQRGKNVYDIEQIDEANFGFLIGKKAFNEWLTRELIHAIKPYNNIANKFIEKVNKIPDWEKQKRISNKAKEIIAYSYVGVIGIQLRKLMAIGEESFSELKQRNYLETAISTAKLIMQLVNFTLLSALWDKQKQNFKELKQEHKQLINTFFDAPFEADIIGTFNLLNALVEIFTASGIEFPIKELNDWKQNLKPDKEFAKACQKILSLNKLLDTDTFSPLDCFEAEKQLTTILASLNFLSTYKMVSVKAINYEELRNNKPFYLHKYTSLGFNTKSEINPEKVNYTNEPVNTDAILLFKGNYRQSLNLFPFVIDLNALTFEGGVKICFYISRNLEDDSLNYRFIENNKIENIEFKNIHKEFEELDEKKKQSALNKLMKSQEKRIIFKTDTVFTMFQDAKNTIIAEDNIDFSDLDEDDDDF